MISVIIPVHNTSRYLARCINSVRHQTFRDWECILVDDCSTDDSVAEAKRIVGVDRRFSIIEKGRNEGCGFARNTGMDSAKGDYVFIDSDDWAHKDLLLHLNAEHMTHPEAARVVAMDMVYVENSKAFIPWSIEPTGLLAADNPYCFTGDCDLGHATACLYDRDAIDDMRFPKVKLFEDMIFNIGLIMAGLSTFVMNRYLYYYVRREGSMLSMTLTEEDAEQERHALSALAERYHPKREVYERFQKFLENALQGRLKK